MAMANPDAPPKVMRRSAASNPPRTGGNSQQGLMRKRDPRHMTLEKQQQIGAATSAESPILRLPRRVAHPDLRRSAGFLPRAVRAASFASAETCCGTSGSVQHGRCQKAHASLLRTCKQIYNEAKPIFYGQNEFTVAFLVGRPYEAESFFPFQLRLDTMCLMKAVAFRDACLCDRWKGGLRRSLTVSGKYLAKSCFGSKTLSVPGTGSFLPLPPKSREMHARIVRSFSNCKPNNNANLCLACASKHLRLRWSII
ncbi:hypothetical protein PG988_014033 [Apiospora saccharicola]